MKGDVDPIIIAALVIILAIAVIAAAIVTGAFDRLNQLGSEAAITDLLKIIGIVRT